jgi:hypothetical protein
VASSSVVASSVVASSVIAYTPLVLREMVGKAPRPRDAGFTPCKTLYSFLSAVFKAAKMVTQIIW